MKRMHLITLCAALLVTPLIAAAQSQSTLDLEKKFDDALALFFYKNTLRMLNQQDNKEFDDLIRNIEKMKFLMINKNQEKFGPKEYRQLTTSYQKESFEPIVTSRFEGKNFDVYLRDAKGSKPGTVVLVNDSTSLFVLDIVGTFDVSKAGALFTTLDNSTDIGKQIRNFANPKEDTVRHRKRRVNEN